MAFLDSTTAEKILEAQFISTMEMFTPRLQQWIQLTGIEFNVEESKLVFSFKSSQHQVFFKLWVHIMHLNNNLNLDYPCHFNEAYSFFRSIKNEKLGVHAGSVK